MGRRQRGSGQGSVRESSVADEPLKMVRAMAVSIKNTKGRGEKEFCRFPLEIIESSYNVLKFAFQRNME